MVWSIDLRYMAIIASMPLIIDSLNVTIHSSLNINNLTRRNVLQTEIQSGEICRRVSTLLLLWNCDLNTI